MLQKIVQVFFLAIVLFFIAPTNTKAQKSRLHLAVRNYTYNTIRPVMKKYHDWLTDSLSDDEKSLIKSLRVDIWEIKQASADQSYNINLQSQQFDQPIMIELFPFLDENQDIFREILESAHIIVERHQTLLDSIYVMMADDRQVWKKDIEEIVNKYRPEPKEKELDHLFFEGDFNLLFEKSIFVLWNENGLLFDLRTPNAEGNVINAIKFAPVPPNRYVNIIISLFYPATVEIKLYNSAGLEIKSLEKNYRKQGTYQVRFNLKKLPEGGYFVRVSSPWDSATLRFKKGLL